jgi:hypothetical protein
MVIEALGPASRIWRTSGPVATNTKTGPGGASKKGKSAQGRVAASKKVGRPKTAEETGKYTAPIPKSVKRSPAWWGALILVLLIGGVGIIVVNYLAHLPFVSKGSAWGLVTGLVMIFAGFMGATKYR